MRLRLHFNLLSLMLSLLPTWTQAQNFPERPVKVVVPFAAGNTLDNALRQVAEEFKKNTGQAIVVENRPGGSGIIAAQAVMQAPPDGYTLLLSNTSMLTINPYTFAKLPYDPEKSFKPITGFLGASLVLAVNATNVPASNVKELIALMKAKPDDFKYASSGVGSTQHIAGEGFDIAAGVKSIHVPYKGSAQAHLDIIAGNVQIMFDTTSSAMGQIKAGKFKPLAVTTAQRSSELPNVPTLAEAGVPGFEMSTWYGVFVTTGTPPDVVNKLQTELTRIIKLPDVQAKLKGLGGEPGNISPEEFSKINKQDFEKFGKLIKQANIKM